MTFATLQDRVDACQSLEALDALGRSLAVQLANESAATLLFRLSIALDERRAELRRLEIPTRAAGIFDGRPAVSHHSDR